jgi:tyrosyl-tRNA synthetase
MNSFIEELRWRECCRMTPEGDRRKKRLASATAALSDCEFLTYRPFGWCDDSFTFPARWSKPLLIGGVTGMIGDPSFKSSERSLLLLHFGSRSGLFAAAI